jgi:hypothetical protein
MLLNFGILLFIVGLGSFIYQSFCPNRDCKVEDKSVSKQTNDLEVSCAEILGTFRRLRLLEPLPVLVVSPTYVAWASYMLKHQSTQGRITTNYCSILNPSTNF